MTKVLNNAVTADKDNNQIGVAIMTSDFSI